MRNKKTFRFKQFSVDHDQCAMKVGTDAVLLGAWVSVSPANRILDIGTGSGVIALMMAQRNPSAFIDAVEIEKQDADQAGANFSNSPYKNIISIHHTAVQNYVPDAGYDLIVSNPPYFQNSLLPPSEGRSRARHTHALSPNGLIQAVEQMLTGNGTFGIILPYVEGEEFIRMAAKKGFQLWRRTKVRSRDSKPFERQLMEFKAQQVHCTEGELTIHNNDNSFTDDYMSLTKEFYLGF